MTTLQSSHPQISTEHQVAPSIASGIATKSDLHSAVSPWLAALAYPLFQHLVFPFYFQRVHIQGQALLPLDGPVILAPTHRSRWDALIIPYATARSVTGRDLHFMVSEDEMHGIQGWLIQRLGGFAINAIHPGRESIRHGVELLRDQQMMVVFPEGNIFRDGQIHLLKPGLAHMALQAATQYDLNVKVVPIALGYSQPIVTWGTEVTVLIGEPLETQNYSAVSLKEGKKQLTAHLQQSLETLNLQIQQRCCESNQSCCLSPVSLNIPCSTSLST
jgi:1-acyl-sn-glycerol-3-phosphate acyltransferase